MRQLLLLLVIFGLVWAYRYAGRARRTHGGQHRSEQRRSGQGPPAPQASGAPPSRATDGTTRPPHEVLGVPRDATPDEVRRAYQQQVRLYHPDKVATVAPELQRLAEQRTKELNAAYRAMTGAAKD